MSNHGDDAVEHNLVSLHWPVNLAGEDDLGRDATNPDLVKQDSGRNCSGECDASGDGQGSCSHRCAVRQVERQDRQLNQGAA